MKDLIWNRRKSLSGDWKLLWTDGQRGMLYPTEALKNYAMEDMDEDKWMDASVPGEVHLELIKAGIIQEPTIGLNVLASRWVEESIWFYRRSFTAPKEMILQRAWLFFEGLDYAAKIYLNGQEIGQHENFFCPFRVEVTGKLREGDNILVVQLESGLFSVSNKTIDDLYYTTHDAVLHKRLWLRKPQSSFSWDWAPRLINVGIHKDVWLEWASLVHVDSVVVRSELADDYHEGTIHIKLHAESLGEEEIEVHLVCMLEETKETKRTVLKVKPGKQWLHVSIPVQSPRLWWPNGHGEQPLYHVHINMQVNEETCLDLVKSTGFRKVRVNQDPHPDGGRYFVIEVNDRPIFAKGANMVPADIIFARLDRSRYEGLINLALEANFNMLRVWGGGLYESDDFYELCDKHGIMVWQEFIFACGGFPATDAAFLANVKAEATFQVRRLAQYPSLVFWCGNNEIELLTWDREQGSVHSDYALYHRVLPQIIKAEDPDKFYLPSSPYSPDYEFPNKDDVGDQHPWSVGIYNSNFYEYRDMICRFPNEGGYLGPNSLDTVLACLPENHQHMHSFAWQIHDNCVEMFKAKSVIDQMLSDWIKREPREMSIEEYVYYGGLIHGEALREYIDNFRRRMYSSAAAIFWMYNDCWPTTRSWTIVDYYQNRTPAFYPVRRAFAPISVVIAAEGDFLNIYGINETNEAWKGELRYGIFDTAGTHHLDQQIEIELPQNQSTRIASYSAEMLKEEQTKSIAFASLYSNNKLAARNRLILARFHEMEWAQANVQVVRSGGELVFTSDTFVWGVCIDLSGKTLLPDNFFDIWPEIEYRIPWPEEQDIPSIIHTGNLGFRI